MKKIAILALNSRTSCRSLITWDLAHTGSLNDLTSEVSYDDLLRRPNVYSTRDRRRFHHWWCDLGASGSLCWRSRRTSVGRTFLALYLHPTTDPLREKKARKECSVPFSFLLGDTYPDRGIQGAQATQHGNGKPLPRSPIVAISSRAVLLMADCAAPILSPRITFIDYQTINRYFC
jgi:hypothetical protein